jgi:hypothetical protein
MPTIVKRPQPDQRKSDECKSSPAVSRGGFGLPIALLCLAGFLAVLVHIFNAVGSPTIWQDTGMVP